MTLRWRYGIHTKNVGSGSLETSGSVATVQEVAQIARSNPERRLRFMRRWTRRPKKRRYVNRRSKLTPDRRSNLALTHF